MSASPKAKLDSSRSISYIDEQDTLEELLELAANSTPEENLRRFCAVLSSQLSMQGIHLKTHPVERSIHYIDP